jgi:23S rRNA (cytosine1962-C5)-methyltransferase
VIPLHRFQVNKRVAKALARKHPWAFVNQCSSALQSLPIGCFVRLVGPDNRFLGIGLYHPLAAIAIRVFCWNDRKLSEDHFFDKLWQAHERRLPLLTGSLKTNAYRLLHGEADGFPGVTIDVFDDQAVVIFHLESWQTHLEKPLKRLAAALKWQAVWIKPWKQKVDSSRLIDLLTGLERDGCEPILFYEQGYQWAAFPASGQKTGFYLDLRGVRAHVNAMTLAHKSVLNLFASSGSLSVIATRQGASRVVSVEQSETAKKQALQLHKANHVVLDEKHWHHADAWEWLAKEDGDVYDVVIVDPPSLISKRQHHDALQKTWIKLMSHCLSRVQAGGTLIAISCTDRMSVDEQKKWTLAAAQKANRALRLETVLPAPDDHPRMATLPERDYFWAFVWHVVD